MRKNLFRTLLCALVIASMLSVPAYAESAVLIGSDINMREGPGTNYRVIDCLPYGARVTVTDRSNGTWYAVEYNGKTGFMSSAFLQLEEDAQPVIQFVSPGGDIYGGAPTDGTGWPQGPGTVDFGSGEPAATDAPRPVSTPQPTPEDKQPVNPRPQPTPTPDAGGTTTVVTTTTTGLEGTVNAMYVRFRSGPGSNYAILGEFNRGKTLVVIGQSDNWLACVADGRTGYIYADYVTLGDAVTITEETTPGVGSTTTVQGSDPYLDPSDATVTTTSTPRPVSTPAPSATPVPPAATAANLTEGVINGSYVRFRTGPGTNYPIIDTYDRDTMLLITGTSGDWTACLILGQAGYVHSNYVKVTQQSVPAQGTNPAPAATPAPTAAPAPTPAPVSKDGYVAGNNVRMRSGASMSSAILDELYYGNKLTITGVVGDWTAVICNGQAGFIYSQFVKEGTFSAGTATQDTGSSGGSTASLSGSSAQKGQQIANFALQYLGYNYSWGGKSPDTGFDCSGFVYYVYGHFGYTLNRVAQDQARNGVAVSPDQLQPGDILCFYNGGSYIGHSGIYIGDGKFIHSQNSATGVVITDLSGSYASRGFEARRIV